MIDLHCHSTVSDGMLSPAEVVRLAHQNGCTLLALTDHDHTGGIAEARAEADRLGLRLINGVEISVTWRGRTIHVVGLDFDEQDENLQNLLAQVRQGRLKRLEAIAAKLEKRGISGAYDGALALAANKKWSAAHTSPSSSFGWDTSKTSSRRSPNTWATANPAPSATNGRRWKTASPPSTARAGWRSSPIRCVMICPPPPSAICLKNLKTSAAQASKSTAATAAKNDRLNYALLAERFGMLASAGSDFHRLNDFSGGILGACPELPENCRPVWAHFSRY